MTLSINLFKQFNQLKEPSQEAPDFLIKNHFLASSCSDSGFLLTMLRDEIFEFPALQLDTLLGEPLGKLGYFAVPLSALGENFNPSLIKTKYY